MACPSFWHNHALELNESFISVFSARWMQNIHLDVSCFLLNVITFSHFACWQCFKACLLRGALFPRLFVVRNNEFIHCGCCSSVLLSGRCLFWCVMVCHSLSSTPDILHPLKPERDEASLMAGAGLVCYGSIRPQMHFCWHARSALCVCQAATPWWPHQCLCCFKLWAFSCQPSLQEHWSHNQTEQSMAYLMCSHCGPVLT